MRLYRCNRIKTKRKERGVGQRRTGEAKFRVLRGVTTASSKTCSWPHDGPHSRAMENTRILCRVGRRPVPPPRTLPPLLRYYYTRGFISRGEMFLLQERIRCRSLAILAARFLLNFFPLVLFSLFILTVFIWLTDIDDRRSTSTWTRMQIDAACPQLSFINIPADSGARLLSML